MIEAKFVETTVNASDIYGIEWDLSIAAMPAFPTSAPRTHSAGGWPLLDRQD